MTGFVAYIEYHKVHDKSDPLSQLRVLRWSVHFDGVLWWHIAGVAIVTGMDGPGEITIKNPEVQRAIDAVAEELRRLNLDGLSIEAGRPAEPIDAWFAHKISTALGMIGVVWNL